MTFKKWEELPVNVRRSRKNLYNYIKAEIEGEGSDDSDPEPTTRDINIVVDDGTDPVQGATVVIGEASKTTGSAGGCSFTGLTDGEKTVTVTAEGYTEKTETITVGANSTSFTISLTAVVAESTPTG